MEEALNYVGVVQRGANFLLQRTSIPCSIYILESIDIWKKIGFKIRINPNKKLKLGKLQVFIFGLRPCQAFK